MAATTGRAMLSGDVDPAGDRRHPFPVHSLLPWVFPIGSVVVFEVQLFFEALALVLSAESLALALCLKSLLTSLIVITYRFNKFVIVTLCTCVVS